MSDLKNQNCVPCRGGEPPLEPERIEDLMQYVGPWELVERTGGKRLRRKFPFKDFATALAFTTRIGEIAEEQGHHPRIVTQWGSVTVDWWTHAIGGLHTNDFIMAGRTDSAYER
jgi:4a-hydroxytetrahydrobiopterin dehydratase